jgi:hypothetical protein
VEQEEEQEPDCYLGLKYSFFFQYPKQKRVLRDNVYIVKKKKKKKKVFFPGKKQLISVFTTNLFLLF